MPGLLVTWSHALAALLYGALALWQLRQWNQDSSNRPLVGAFAATALWCLAVATLGPQSALAGLAESGRARNVDGAVRFTGRRVDSDVQCVLDLGSGDVVVVGFAQVHDR